MDTNEPGREPAAAADRVRAAVAAGAGGPELRRRIRKAHAAGVSLRELAALSGGSPEELRRSLTSADPKEPWQAAITPPEARQRARLRGRARRLGYGIRKRRAAAGAPGRGGYLLYELATGKVVAGARYELDLEQLEHRLDEIAARRA